MRPSDPVSLCSRFANDITHSHWKPAYTSADTQTRWWWPWSVTGEC